MENTDILIIIGYSFPFFNRVADRYILQPYLEAKGKIRIIYFQDSISFFPMQKLIHYQKMTVFDDSCLESTMVQFGVPK